MDWMYGDLCLHPDCEQKRADAYYESWYEVECQFEENRIYELYTPDCSVCRRRPYYTCADHYLDDLERRYETVWRPRMCPCGTSGSCDDHDEDGVCESWQRAFPELPWYDAA